MLENIKTALKTGLSLSGSILMMGGSLVFAESSLLKYLSADEDSPAPEIIGATAFLSLAYVMIFSRGISLWNYFSKSDQQNQTHNIPTNSEVIPFKKTGYSIGATGSVSFLSYSFFAAFVASKALLNISDSDSSIPQLMLWMYTWISLGIVYVNFALPRAINNGRDLAQLLISPNNQSNSNYRQVALWKTFGSTALGTVSFGALAIFLLEEALNVMPIAKDFSPATKDGLTYLIAILTAIMFGLSKSLECYQYFSGGRHFKKVTQHINNFPPKARCLLHSHQVVGTAYLFFIFTAYFRVNLNLLEKLGADISLQPKSWYSFLIATLLSSSSLFIERVFSYKNMMVLTKSIFTPQLPLYESLLEKQEDKPLNEDYDATNSHESPTGSPS